MKRLLGEAALYWSIYIVLFYFGMALGKWDLLWVSQLSAMSEVNRALIGAFLIITLGMSFKAAAPRQ